jgi:hypothetical protein
VRNHFRSSGGTKPAIISRAAAKEYSQRRKPWVKGENEAALEGRKEEFSRTHFNAGKLERMIQVP